MSEKIEALWAVFGLNAEGRPHAAKFPDVHGDLAQRAATSMGYHAVKVVDDDALKLVDALPFGRVYATGKSLTPFVKQTVYDELLKLVPPGDSSTASTVAPKAEAGAAHDATPVDPADASEGHAVAESAASAHPPSSEMKPSLSSHWNEIGLGSVVLATAPGVEGWWEAEVVGVSAKGKMLTLRWKGYEAEPAFMTPRTQVALPFPSAA